MTELLLPDARELVRAYTQSIDAVTDIFGTRGHVRRLPGVQKWPAYRINSAAGRAIDPVPTYADQPIIFVTVFGWVKGEPYEAAADSPFTVTSDGAAVLRQAIAAMPAAIHEGAVVTATDRFSSVRDLDDTSFGVARPALQFDFRLTYHAATTAGS